MNANLDRLRELLETEQSCKWLIAEFFDYVPDLLLLTSVHPDTNKFEILKANQAFMSLVDCVETEVLGKSPSDFMLKADRERVSLLVDRAMEEDVVGKDLDKGDAVYFRIVTKKGPVWVEWYLPKIRHGLTLGIGRTVRKETADLLTKKYDKE